MVHVWEIESGDGLTDGQEVYWVTSAKRGRLGSIKKDFSPGTNPSKKDTDDDGYWDGWIGVHGCEKKNARRRRKP